MSQNVINERDVLHRALIKKKEEQIHTEREIESTEREMDGLHSLKVRAHPQLARHKVYGYMH